MEERIEMDKVGDNIDERMKEIESNRIAKAEEVLAFLSASLRGEVLEEVVSTETDETGGIRPVIIKKQINTQNDMYFDNKFFK